MYVLNYFAVILSSLFYITATILLIIASFLIDDVNFANVDFLHLNWSRSPFYLQSCPANSTKLISSAWPGTTDGCVCLDETTRGRCSVARGNNCRTVDAVNSIDFAVWKDNLMCSEEADYFSIDVRKNCGQDTECGIIDTFGNKLCSVRKQCPESTFGFVLGNILVDYKIASEGICLEKNETTDSWERYVLEQASNIKCTEDKLDASFYKVDSQQLSSFYKQNGLVSYYSSLHNYDVSHLDTTVNLYASSYVGLTDSCRKQLSQIWKQTFENMEKRKDNKDMIKLVNKLNLFGLSVNIYVILIYLSAMSSTLNLLKPNFVLLILSSITNFVNSGLAFTAYTTIGTFVNGLEMFVTEECSSRIINDQVVSFISELEIIRTVLIIAAPFILAGSLFLGIFVCLRNYTVKLIYDLPYAIGRGEMA